MAWTAVLCLLPSAAWGAGVFGARAALVVAIAVAAALAAEAAGAALRRTVTLHDGTAFYSGLLIGCLLPPTVPLYVPAAAAGFALLVVKQTFGGLGRNWMNPALAGVIAARLCWPEAFAVPAGTFWTAASLPQLAASPSALQASPLDAAVLGWLNRTLLSPLGLRLPPGTFDLLVGIRAGNIGELSVPLLAAGGAVLAARRIVRWQLPVAFLAAFMLLAWVFGGLTAGAGLFAGLPLSHLAAGSLLLVALFAATDPVTSPLTASGQVFFGLGAGCLAFVLRFHGTLLDGTAPAVLLMNGAVPLIDRWTRPRRLPRASRGATP
jgi:electron transport complex protein RnfD